MAGFLTNSRLCGSCAASREDGFIYYGKIGESGHCGRGARFQRARLLTLRLKGRAGDSAISMYGLLCRCDNVTARPLCPIMICVQHCDWMFPSVTRLPPRRSAGIKPSPRDCVFTLAKANRGPHALSRRKNPGTFGRLTTPLISRLAGRKGSSRDARSCAAAKGGRDTARGWARNVRFNYEDFSMLVMGARDGRGPSPASAALKVSGEARRAAYVYIPGRIYGPVNSRGPLCLGTAFK